MSHIPWIWNWSLLSSYNKYLADLAGGTPTFLAQVFHISSVQLQPQQHWYCRLGNHVVLVWLSALLMKLCRFSGSSWENRGKTPTVANYMDIFWKSSISDLPQDNLTGFSLGRVINWKNKPEMAPPVILAHVATLRVLKRVYLHSWAIPQKIENILCCTSF